MPTYPSSLPAPQMSGYSVETRDNTIRSAMDGGVARVRQKHTTPAPQRVSVRWRLSQADLALFDAWMNLYGQDWFDFTNIGQARLVSLNMPMAPMGSTAIWEVTAEMEVKP